MDKENTGNIGSMGILLLQEPLGGTERTGPRGGD